jgi:tetratricopeptide (TPR) repeat protein
MKTNLILVLAFGSFILTSSLFAQNIDLGTGTKRAVVIGISDYSDPDIPDLKFAHRDAEAFAEYLQSKAGGELNEDQLTLMINEEATFGEMTMAFDDLVDNSNEGDMAIIYFSGHGDVESRYKQGFLLNYDSSPKVYMASAFSLNYLQVIISTLSEKNVQVLLVTDACHAGALAGSSINGTNKTAAILAQQFSNAVKILSCQPEEYSLEGEQWGGGRGVFSYHFVNGLYGLADRNEDLQVNLFEIDRYIGDKVSEEAAPESQYPLVNGNKTTLLSYVDRNILEDLRAKKEKEAPKFESTASRGLEDEVLAAADSKTRKQYLAFKEALAKNELMSPSKTCANDLYVILSKNPSLRKLYNRMRRNLAAALMDESQKVVNNVLKNDPDELAKMFGRGQYRHIPVQLGRAAELLGEKHYIYHRIKGLEYAFVAYNKLTNTASQELFILQNRAAIPYAKKALSYLGEGAFIYDFLGSLYAPIHADSAEYYFNKSLKLSPTYASPYNNRGVMYSWTRNRPMQMMSYKKAIKTDPKYFAAYHNIGLHYSTKGKYEQAESWYHQSINAFPNVLAYSNLGKTYYEQELYEDAEAMCLKAIEIQPTYYNSYLVLADIYQATQQDDKLTELLLKMEKLADDKLGEYAKIATAYLYLGDEANFQKFYFKADARFEQFKPAYFYKICRTYALQNKKEEALNWLELAFNRGFNDRKKLREDEDLNSIRKEARFRALKKEYRENFKITCKECIWNSFNN